MNYENGTELILSVRLMTYNHGLYIERALRSIDEQETNFNFEIVIGDDFSTDDTTHIIQNYVFTNKRLKLNFLNRKVGGAYHKKRIEKGRLYNFFDILNNCHGKYIALLDGGDYWTDPYKLQKQIDFLQKNEDYQICFHRIEIYDQKQKRIFTDEITRKVPSTIGIEELSNGNFIHTPSVVIKNDFVIPEWFINSALGDWTFYMISIGSKKIKKLDEVMSCYRIHDSSIWSSKMPQERISLTLRAMETVKENLEVSPKVNKILENRINGLKTELAKQNGSSNLVKIEDKKPLVSVCIPTYNGEQFLNDALISVSKQTYDNIEIIISDDGSKDGTLDLIKKFSELAKLEVQIFHHKPAGIGANWNACIKKAKGKYIKFLFQDDILFPSCIEDMVRVAESEKNVGLVASKRKFIVEDNCNEEINRWMHLYKDLQFKLDLKQDSVALLEKDLMRKKSFTEYPFNKVGEPTAVLFPRAIIKKAGLFREDLHQILDYEFYYRILKLKKIAIINKELVGFRLHPLQTTNINRNLPINDYILYDKILFKEFFWYLSKKEKLRLLGKFHPRIFKGIKLCLKLFK